jgi:hypothetical protein
VVDGVFGASSYLLTDRSNEAITVYSLVWQQGNILASIDLNAPLHGGPTPADAQDLAAKVLRRIAADIPA